MQPLVAHELTTLRTCVNCQQPFGTPEWQQQLATTLELLKISQSRWSSNEGSVTLNLVSTKPGPAQPDPYISYLSPKCIDQLGE